MISNEVIRIIALQYGFKLKGQPSGEDDLNPCVYDFARKLINMAGDQVASATPTPLGQEREILKVIDERDQYHEWADKLADAIAERLGVDIGEHSNLNSPWENALEFIEATPPEVEPVYQVKVHGAVGTWVDVKGLEPHQRALTRTLYTSPPSPPDDESGGTVEELRHAVTVAQLDKLQLEEELISLKAAGDELRKAFTPTDGG